MAVVPNPTGFSVGLEAGIRARVPDATTQNPGPRQLAEAGAAITNVSGEMAGIARDAQIRANDIRVNDALNALKERSLDLTFGKDEGFTNLRGDAALTRPGGKSLFDEYGGKLSETEQAAYEGLANDAQRQAYKDGAAQIRQTYDGNLLKHYNSEAQTFALSTNSGMIATAQREISLSGGDPKVIASASERINMATTQSFQLLGKSSVEAEAQGRKFVSEGHKLAVVRMLENNETSSATAYFAANKGSMEAEDYIWAEAKLHDINRISEVTGFVSEMLNAGGPSGAATPFDVLTSAVLGAEGGGTLSNPKVSPKGARGPMQVMPGTNLDPGYGVAPAKDNSEAERARVGRDYLAAMVKQYGTRLGVAAYNGGPGRMDKAIARSKKEGGDPMRFMPKESRDYADKVMKSVGGKSAGDPKMSLSAGLNSIRQRYKDDPEAMAEAERQYTSGYNAMLADKGRNEEEAVNGAMEEIYKNGGTVTPQIAARVPGQFLDNLNNFATNIRNSRNADKNGQLEGTSTLYWARLKEGIANGTVTSQNQILQQAPNLTTQDFRDLTQDLASVTAGDRKKVDSYSTIRETLNFLHGEMAAAGLDFSPDSKDKKAAEQYSKFTAQLFKQITTLESIRGKPLEPMEARRVALDMLGDAAGTGGWFSKDKKVFELQNPALTLRNIPADMRVYLSNRLREARLPVNDNNIRWALNQLGTQGNGSLDNTQTPVPRR